MSDWTFVDAFASIWGNESTDGAAEVVTCQTREVGQDGGVGDANVELWGAGCVVFRPAPPDDDGKCQLLTVQIGAQQYAVGANDSRAANATGALNPGDAAFCSPTGKVALRANANGSISLIKQGEKADAYISIQKDGTIVIGNQWGQLEIGKNGVVWAGADSSAMQINKAAFQVISDMAALNVGSIAFGVAACAGLGVPLCFVPTVPTTGTVGPGFVCAKLVQFIYV